MWQPLDLNHIDLHSLGSAELCFAESEGFTNSESRMLSGASANPRDTAPSRSAVEEKT
jgi:hypothetical protein